MDEIVFLRPEDNCLIIGPDRSEIHMESIGEDDDNVSDECLLLAVVAGMIKEQYPPFMEMVNTYAEENIPRSG